MMNRRLVPKQQQVPFDVQKIPATFYQFEFTAAAPIQLTLLEGETLTLLADYAHVLHKDGRVRRINLKLVTNWSEHAGFVDRIVERHAPTEPTVV